MQGTADLCDYLGRQLARHGGRRELAVAVIAGDLRMSPNDVQRCGALLRRARVVTRYAPSWYTTRHDGRPVRPTGIWAGGERGQQAAGVLRRGGTLGLWSWLLSTREQLAVMMDKLRECKDRLGFLSKASQSRRAERASARAPSAMAAAAAGAGPSPPPAGPRLRPETLDWDRAACPDCQRETTPYRHTHHPDLLHYQCGSCFRTWATMVTPRM